MAYLIKNPITCRPGVFCWNFSGLICHPNLSSFSPLPCWGEPRLVKVGRTCVVTGRKGVHFCSGAAVLAVGRKGGCPCLGTNSCGGAHTPALGGNCIPGQKVPRVWENPTGQVIDLSHLHSFLSNNPCDLHTDLIHLLNRTS